MARFSGRCRDCDRRITMDDASQFAAWARSGSRCPDCQAAHEARPPRTSRIGRACTVCGRSTHSQARRCADHPARWEGSNRWRWSRQRPRILERDEFRCTAVLADGTRCPATSQLEVHHLRPGSAVGVPDDQLTTRCRAHNPRGG